MRFKEIVLFSVNNLRARKLRSWLTIIGVVIGIAAVVALILVSQGLQNAIEQQFEKMGVNAITVMASAGQISTPLASLVSEKPLTERDVDAIKKITGVERVMEIIFLSGQAEIDGKKINTFISGIPVEDMDLIFGERGYRIVEGRSLRNKNGYEAIIGNDLYNGVGRLKKVRIRDKVVIGGNEFRVVGAIEKIGNRMDDMSIIIPLETFREIYDVGDKVGMIYVKVEKGRDVNDVAERIRKKLRKVRGEREGEETFSVTTSQQLLQIFKNIFGLVQIIVVGIAAISLVVGGIGIMNTMYMSVLERTRQIGVMKAIGAKDRQILSIFVIESGIIGLVGGIIGVIVGVFASKAVEFVALNAGFVLLKIVISPYIILFALSFGFLIGVVSGFTPARQAAKLNPVEALRYE